MVVSLFQFSGQGRNQTRRLADDRKWLSWRTTRRSSNFDSTDRLEIGRYELTSAVLSPGFLFIRVMNASLNTAGKCPVVRERL